MQGSQYITHVIQHDIHYKLSTKIITNILYSTIINTVTMSVPSGGRITSSSHINPSDIYSYIFKNVDQVANQVALVST